MKVEVTQEHIENGIPEDECRCPVALALEDLGYQLVEVGTALVWTDAGKALLPYIAAAFIGRFDRGHCVQPFTFEIELPPPNP